MATKTFVGSSFGTLLKTDSSHGKKTSMEKSATIKTPAGQSQETSVLGNSEERNSVAENSYTVNSMIGNSIGGGNSWNEKSLNEKSGKENSLIGNSLNGSSMGKTRDYNQSCLK